ncbi:amino acid permease [Aliifodinibius sp. S!AR15-10]|uniref:amino acid permease n=1 Tax=Aliifodinibius sp. S!AR15-10 TaxID=2950437 RepID=UPI00285457E2|nr:amino acid permease [Aliifodinibius sp. S!AR15-10]MDR8392195.1 amino acid permease [Aliifodinibius sp. S!AR15-10]
MPILDKTKKLKKQLGAFDVFAIATGAMFSSGLFLLPGIAAGETGPSVFLAYLVSGLLVLPTMLSKAELATAFPRAGGTYYIIDRTLGPLMGSIGGFGSWFSLVFKSAFALIGMGAYISIFFEVPITPVAVILTIAFGALNIFGAKETTKVQNILVLTLISIMAFYLVQGFSYLFSMDILDIHRKQFTPFFANGAQGFFGTVGMVFVSYAGLTKVVSVAEEVEDPDRNIPRGMFLSIITAITVYVAGVYLMTAVLEPEAFRQDLTPVATAGEIFLTWLPGDTGLILIVIAAISAFASTGNAGIMSASRFPLAMARDKLLHPKLSEIGKFDTPMVSIVATTGMMVFLLLVFNVEEVAKLASAFKLLLFGLLNLAVIVMRESQIKEYDPGYTSPFYPWIQMIGMVTSGLLIFEMGLVSILFTVAVTILSVAWYYYYAYGKIDRQGAIFHVHERLGQYKDRGLEHEMRRIMQEKGLREEDPYELVISKAAVLDVKDPAITYKDIVKHACRNLATKVDVDEDKLFQAFDKMSDFGAISLGKGAALNHTRLDIEAKPELFIVRIKHGLSVESRYFKNQKKSELHAIFFLVSSEKYSTQHLRFLAHIAEMIDQDHFLQHWIDAKDEGALREMLLRDERFITLTIDSANKTKDMIGKKIHEIELPGESLIAILRREGNINIPHGNTVIQEGDKLSIIGEVEDIERIREMKEN